MKNFFVLTILLSTTLYVIAQTSQLTLNNQCSTPQQVLLLSEKRDTLLKKWIDTTYSFDIKLPLTEVATLFIDQYRDYILPLKEVTIDIDCLQSPKTVFTDPQHQIYNTGKRKRNATHQEFMDIYYEYIYLDSLKNPILYHTWSDQLDSLAAKTDTFQYNYFLKHAPSLASLRYLYQETKQKSLSPENNDVLYLRFTAPPVLNRHPMFEAVRVLRNIEELKTNDTIRQFAVSSKDTFHLSADHYLLYYIDDFCSYAATEMKLLMKQDSLLHTKNIQLILLDLSNAKKYRDFCEQNNWHYFADPHFLEQKLAYQLRANTSLYGVFIDHQKIIKKDFHWEIDKELLNKL